MVHNESFFLPRWLEYYGNQFGPENLFVLDHGSTDGSTEGLRGTNRIRLPRTEFDDEQRTNFVSDLIKGFLRFWDIAIYTDCDEFLVPDPLMFEGLRDYCARMIRPASYSCAVDVRQLLGVEPPINPDAPILGQRRFCRLRLSMSKPLITRVPIRWNPGFHCSDQKPGMDPNLILFHLKYIDLKMCLDRLAYTREMQWSEKSLRLGRGKHQRSDDEAMIGRFQVDRKSYREGVAPFDFSEVAAQVEALAAPDKKGIYIRHVPETSRFMEIPERFFGIV
jgi:hypothetical protein